MLLMTTWNLVANRMGKHVTGLPIGPNAQERKYSNMTSTADIGAELSERKIFCSVRSYFFPFGLFFFLLFL